MSRWVVDGVAILKENALVHRSASQVDPDGLKIQSSV